MPELIAQNFLLVSLFNLWRFPSFCSRFRAIQASSAFVPSQKGSYETTTVTAMGASKNIPHSWAWGTCKGGGEIPLKNIHLRICISAVESSSYFIPFRG